jgi:hypothetical protein
MNGNGWRRKQSWYNLIEENHKKKNPSGWSVSMLRFKPSTFRIQVRGNLPTIFKLKNLSSSIPSRTINIKIYTII